MGALYLAVDPALDRQVAIKVVRDFQDDPALRERFYREARAIAALQHRNIVTIYELGESETRPFIAMEYLPGPSLADIIRRTPPLPLARRLEIMIDVCAGLAYAHRAGMIHRDVKPANVMLLEDGTAKVLDFGVARLAQDLSDGMTVVGTLLGTPAYMSPEMVSGQPVDHRADIFAVGVMLYELITSKKPFAGDNSSVIGFLTQIVNHVPPPPSQLVPTLPAKLDAIVACALEKDPEQRYPQIDEMRDDLREVRDALGAEPTSAEATVFRVSRSELPSPTLYIPPPEQAASPPPPQSDGTVMIPAPSTREAQPQRDDEGGVHLLVVRSPDPRQSGRTVPVPATGSLTLGRGEGSDIVVKDLGLSRRHAAIESRDGGFVIVDLGSANGTFVNGKRIAHKAAEPLFFGATITIGETVLTLSYPRDTMLPDVSGVIVAQRYELQRLLRESAKAALYAARDRNVPRDVAVKLLSPELARYASYREQFEREASIAAHVQHPHICQVLDSGLTRISTPSGRHLETHFLCFELMAGGSLTARMKRNEPVLLQDVHRWVTMMGSALQYAHDQKVVHGDLKPSAIVFDAASNLYLTDFSIAQKALVEERGATGSPAFMAPELWDGEPPSPATDQFGFAALVYYMLAGTAPFVGQDNPDIRRKNFRSGPAPVHEEAAQNGRTGVSRAVSEVLRRALGVSPKDRYPSVEQFTRALLKALGTGHVAGAEPLVFISYDRELSGGWARFFADRLKLTHSIKVFMDTTGLDRAGRFSPRLRRAIEDCDVFICFLAGETLQSKWVSEEIRLAHELGKTMIPIFQESYRDPEAVDDASPVGALIAHQGIKLFDVSGHFVEHAVTDLAHMVKGAVSGEADFA
jgi:serine/threonine protein kinase